jgi:hypothetical protein
MNSSERPRAAGVGEEQGRGHGADDRAAHGHARGDVIAQRDVRPLLVDLVHGGGDVHGHVHERAGGGDEDPGHEEAGQVDLEEARVEEARGEGLDRAVDAELASEEHGEAAG